MNFEDMLYKTALMPTPVWALIKMQVCHFVSNKLLSFLFTGRIFTDRLAGLEAVKSI